MHPVLDDLITLLQLERIEDNIFRGDSRDIGSAQVFGGQVLGQALSAAHHTVEGRTAHSLHSYFLRRGDVEALHRLQPFGGVLFETEVDGGLELPRQVVAPGDGVMLNRMPLPGLITASPRPFSTSQSVIFALASLTRRPSRKSLLIAGPSSV